jgi:GxxExxY protein
MSDFRKLIANVYTELGPGFTESLYHSALEVGLRLAGLRYDSERILPVMYQGHAIGNVRPDLVIHDPPTVIELKSTQGLVAKDRLQIRTYMRLLNISKGYLVNFSPTRLEIEELNGFDIFP